MGGQYGHRMAALGHAKAQATHMRQSNIKVRLKVSIFDKFFYSASAGNFKPIKKAELARYSALIKSFLFLFGFKFLGSLQNLIAQNLILIMLHAENLCNTF